MKETARFDLAPNDEYAIETSIKITRKLLLQDTTTPRQIVGLGHALYALERLPIVTPGVWVEFDVSFRQDFEISGGMRYVDFKIFERIIAIGMGGSEWTKEMGSDSFSEQIWGIAIGTGRRDKCVFYELYNLEETVQEYLNLGGTITLEDESEIVFE